VLAGVVAMRMTCNKEKSLATAIAVPEVGKRVAESMKSPPPSGPTTLVAASGPKPGGWASVSDLGSRGTSGPSAPKPPEMSYMPDPSLAGSRHGMHLTPPPTLSSAPAPTGTTLALRPTMPADTPPSLPVPPADNPFRTAYSVNSAPDTGPVGGAVGRHHRYPMESSGSTATAAPSPPPPSQFTYTAGRYGSPPEPGPAMRSVSMPMAPPPNIPPERQPVERVTPGGTYKVQPSDNYWRISEKLYGTGAYFKALAEHNRDHIGRDDRLLPGTTLDAPTAAQLEEKYSGLCPKASHQRPPAGARIANVSSGARLAGRRTYKVEAGDTLYDIAKHELGNPGRWGEIYQINRDVLGEDYDYLSPGLELVLPEGSRRDTLTRNPDGMLRR
jgi:nucleoid-associated protein YgaU